MTQDELPNFDRENKGFKNGDDVYVIDGNGYDIYLGKIVNVVGDTYAIHYPAWPEDDEELNGSERLLALSDRNKEIFEQQEKLRREIEIDEPKPKKKRYKPKVVKKTKPKGSRSNPKRDAAKGKKKYV